RCALKDFCEPFTGERVDAGVWRGSDRVVAAFTQLGHELRSNQAGASDDDEFHDRCPFRVDPLHSTGVRIGAPLSFTRNTRNLAGAVSLAVRPTMWMSSGPS